MTTNNIQYNIKDTQIDIKDTQIAKKTYYNESKFCQKVDRLLTGNVKITVSECMSNHPLGMTTNNLILLNFTDIERQSISEQDFVTRFKGINYHELSHILFTNINIKNNILENSLNIPELDNVGYLSRRRLVKSINILEDSRAENLMSVKYPNASKYFMYVVLKFIINKDSILLLDEKEKLITESSKGSKSFNDWILTYGRKFVDRNIVSKFEQSLRSNKYMSDKDIKEVKDIIDKYIVTHDRRELIILGIRLDNILNQLPENIQQQSTNTPKISGEKINNELKDLEKQLSEAIENQKEESKNNKTKKIDSNKGTTRKESQDIKESINELNNTINEISNDIEEDIHQDIDVIYDENSGIMNDNDDNVHISSNSFEPSIKHQIVSRRIEQLIKRLRNGLQSGYMKNMKVGRIDTRRVMNTNGHDNRVFKRYQPSRLSKSKMGISILLDSSASMNGKDYSIILECAWALDRALTSCFDKSMIIEYSNDFKIIKKFNNMTGDWKRHFDSGTNPAKALEKSLNNLLRLRVTDNVKTNIVIIFTDGEWQNSVECENIIKKMNNNDITTVLVIPKNFDVKKTFSCSEVHRIENLESIEKVMRSVISKVQMNIRSM